jgi:hypothetical protein
LETPATSTDTGDTQAANSPDHTLADLTGKLIDHAGTLGVALAQWAARDTSEAGPSVRHTADTAVDAVDQMLHLLHLARAKLVGEMRVFDDAELERSRALLAELHGGTS